MTRPLRAFWWSPRRAPRTLLSECRQNGVAWAHLGWPVGRAFTNHGDELSQLVLREATGRTVEWAPLGREDVVAIGSLLVLYLRQGGVGQIWGSGIHAPEVSDADRARVADRVLAVRGPLARTTLGLPETTQLGDPGLLVRGFTPRAPRRAGSVLITHFTSHRTAEERARIRAVRAAGVRILPPTLAPEEMLREIAGADHVMSAGMHGVILAHALRTPATLVSLKSPHPTSAGFKYHDYHQSVGLSPRLVPWTDIIDAGGRARELDIAAGTVATVDARIDALVAGLLEAAAPLRSGR